MLMKSVNKIKNWLIKKLGGFTKEDSEKLLVNNNRFYAHKICAKIDLSKIFYDEDIVKSEIVKLLIEEIENEIKIEVREKQTNCNDDEVECYGELFVLKKV